MSTHRVDVIRIPAIERHPNADSLGLVKIGGYTCVIKLGDFQDGDLAIYIEPDYVVSDEPEFAFLGEHRRIKARRFRGIYSQGLLVKARPGMQVGDDVMEALRIVRYEPLIEDPSQDERPHTSIAAAPVYDVENWRGALPDRERPAERRALRDLFVPGEEVVVTEKLHGCNARFAWRDGRLWMGSRTRWKNPTGAHEWARAVRDNDWIAPYCQSLGERYVVYGEVFGQVKGFDYGIPKGKIGFRLFDILEGGRWVDAKYVFSGAEGQELGRAAPVVYRGPYDAAKMEELAVMDSVLGRHMAEGIVIKPVTERTDPLLGRVMLKLVSNRYLEKA